MGDPAWLTIEHEGERRHVRLDLKLTTIGRNEANVIDVPDKNLSRFHCEIERRGDDYVVRDAGSRNGTTLNGVKLAGPTVLAAGDKIEIGSAVL
ncbi:MAG TPA: FHA domain-containing protein, partial [Planctomycetota bacterium]|nr:FHA domain-containing protein [Planctomycetota bacterium]